MFNSWRKDKQNTHTCYYDMLQYEPLKHHTKWKKQVTEDRIVYDSIFMKCPE